MGAYGLRVTGLEEAAALLVRADPAWPAIEVVSRRAKQPAAPERLTDDVADLHTRSGSRVRLERRSGLVVFESTVPLSAQALVHPGLAPVAAVMAHWLGRQSFHGGGIVVGGRAWGLFGRRGSGKSTTLVRAAQLGAEVVADDLLVVARGTPFSGPRSIDLRRETAKRLGLGQPLGIVGTRERWRFALPPAPPDDVTLAGWVFLEWGDRLMIEHVGPPDRLQGLVEHRGISVEPRDLTALLDLAALPALRLTRPRSLGALDAAVTALLERIA